MQLNKHKSQVAQLLLSLAVIGTAAKAFPGFESLFFLTPLSLGIILTVFLYSERENFFSRLMPARRMAWFDVSLKTFILYPLSFVLVFALWCLLSTFWSLYPKVTLMRSAYLLFLIITIFVAAYMIDWKQTKYKFAFLLPLNIMIVISSLISLILNIPESACTGGNAKGFMGFTAHQNTLGALILFTSPAVIERLYIHYKSSDKKNVFLLTSDFCILISGCILLTLTYSRASITSFLILIIILLLLQGSKLVLFLSTVSITALILSFVFIPSLRNSMKNIVLKDTQSITETRLPLWQASNEAAQESWFIGLGYGISHPVIKSGGAGDHYENGRFIREKGNSILAMIEEVGIIGLILFMLPILIVLSTPIKFIWKKGKMEEWKNVGIQKNQLPSHRFTHSPLLQFSFSPIHVSRLTFHFSLVSAFLLASAFHAQFEAWWIGVGSFQLFIFIAILFTLGYDKKQTVIIGQSFQK